MRRNILLPTAVGGKAVPTAWATVYNGSATCVRGGSEASVDNLHDAAFTAEAWINTGHSGTAYIVAKPGASKGWVLCKAGTGTQLVGIVFCATTSGICTSVQAINDNAWHHVAMTWDDAGDRKVYLYLDGSAVGTPNAGDGAVLADAGDDLYIGTWNEGALFWDGRIGWVRISNNVRYTGATYTVPSRITPPDNDANTVRLFKMDEGTGTTINDSSTNAQDGTLVTGTWLKS